MRKFLMAAAIAALGLGCASTPSKKQGEPVAPSEVGEQQKAAGGEVKRVAEKNDVDFVDTENGFQIHRPSDAWAFSSGKELSTDSIAVPVVIANAKQGAQVVVQIAPAVATPAQFAERLTEGLNTRAGFQTTEVKPIPLAEGAVGFDFSVADQVAGRVAILEGSEGRVYVLLATWQQGAPAEVESDINAIIGSLKLL